MAHAGHHQRPVVKAGSEELPHPRLSRVPSHQRDFLHSVVGQVIPFVLVLAVCGRTRSGRWSASSRRDLWRWCSVSSEYLARGTRPRPHAEEFDRAGPLSTSSKDGVLVDHVDSWRLRT